jgi:hypothetical protein
MMRRGTSAWLLALLSLAPAGGAAQTYLLVVSGIGGEPQYRAAFEEWSTTLLTAAQERLGLPTNQIVYLREDPEGYAGSRKSTKANLDAAVTEIAGRAEPDALVVIVFIGHGSAVGGSARINLPGPDVSAEEVAALLTRFPTQQLVVANLASASGDFLPILSGPRRTIITATRSGRERYETVFAGLFVGAFASDGADTDKDERVSVLEAFEFARREVTRHYETGNRLVTEHALLDDNGDATGSTEPDLQAGDGALAARLFLDNPLEAAIATLPDDPDLRALFEARQRLELEIATLRARKDQLAPEAYETEFERLALELARTSRAIREREARNPE